MVNRYLWSAWKLDLFFYFKCIQLLCRYKSPLRALDHVEDTFNQLEFTVFSCCRNAASQWPQVEMRLVLQLNGQLSDILPSCNYGPQLLWSKIPTTLTHNFDCNLLRKYYKYCQYRFLCILLILYILLNTYLFYLAFLAFFFIVFNIFIYLHRHRNLSPSFVPPACKCQLL